MPRSMILGPLERQGLSRRGSLAGRTPRWRSFALVASLLLSWNAPGISLAAQKAPQGRPEPGAPASPPAEEGPRGQAIDVVSDSSLIGQDQEAGLASARKLLEGLVKGDSEQVRELHLAALQRWLDPRAKFDPGSSELLAALRILAALEERVVEAGPPSSGLSGLLLPLVGVGPIELRRATVTAAQSVASFERAHLPQSPLCLGLAERIGGDPPPHDALLADAAAVLWRVEPATHIGCLLGALRSHQERSADAAASARAIETIHDELRSRLPVDFSTLEGWEKWWAEVKDKPIAIILDDGRRRSVVELASAWRLVVRRLRETEDRERLLLALQESLDTSATPEIRIAAAQALGDLSEGGATPKAAGAAAPGSASPSPNPGAPASAPGAAPTVGGPSPGVGAPPNSPGGTGGASGAAAGRVPPAGAAPAPPGAAAGAGPSAAGPTLGDPRGAERDRDRWMQRASGLLVNMLSHKGLARERPEVARAALASLRRFHVYFERSSQAKEEVTRLVLERLAPWKERKLDSSRSPETVQEVVETLRLAGALKATAARGAIEALLEQAQGAEEVDLVWITEVVVAIGRLSDAGLTRPDAARVISLFSRWFSAATTPARELRRACVATLGAAAENPEMAGDLESFYVALLFGGGEKDLRIPAILGLGTLARQRRPEARAALIRVLDEQSMFDPQEVLAAADSLAYVGGDAALGRFLKCLGETRDKVVRDHLWKKALSLIESGGDSVLIWSLLALENLALEEDAYVYLEYSALIGATPSVGERLSEQSVLLDPESVAGRERWAARMAILRALDVLGRDEEVGDWIARIQEMLTDNPELTQTLKDVPSQLEGLQKSLRHRSAVRERLQAPLGDDLAAPLAALRDLVVVVPSVTGRWGNLSWVARQLASLPVGASSAALVELYASYLKTAAPSGYWEGFPPEFKGRHQARLEALAREKRGS